MPHTVMLWLVHPESDGADGEGRRIPAPRGSAGVHAPPPFTHLSYGVFEDERQLDEALAAIASVLDRGGAVRVTHGTRTFLVPAARIHYVVAEEVSRPVDGREPYAYQPGAGRS